MNFLTLMLLLAVAAAVPSLVVLTEGARWSVPLLTGPVLAGLGVALVFAVHPAGPHPLIRFPSYVLGWPRINGVKLIRAASLVVFGAYLVHLTLEAL